jgi:glycosyltransferase involved in cell wall biosynthesis
VKLVSVIMPVFNNERFISDAIESVLRQTYDRWELLIVDDGSNDASGRIAESYERRFPGQIWCLRQDNRGPGAARNRGIRRARGRYVAFIDADDVWLPVKLERQVAALERDAAVGLVYCDNYFVDEKRQAIPGYRREVTLYQGQVAPMLFQHYFIITSAVVIRRACCETVGQFREDIRVGEDYDYFLRCAQRYPVGLVAEKLYERRHRSGSMSSRDDAVNARNDIEILTTFARENTVFYRNNRSAVRSRLRDYHFSLGYYYLQNGWNAEARKYFSGSLRYGVSAKGLKGLCLWPVPYRWVHAFKRIIRRDVNTGDSR